MSKPLFYTAFVIVGVIAATLAVLRFIPLKVAVQRAVSPGELSPGHAYLADRCDSCHTSFKGVESKNCIVCHADNKALLQRQPTAFHATIKNCVACHFEHQGDVARMTKMDHVVLGRIGLKEFQKKARQNPDEAARVHQIKNALAQSGNTKNPASPNLHREEALLDCAKCHKTKDRHLGLFGTDCAQCHGTTKWTIPEYRHPSLVSQTCAQCHLGPPSHYMMHFQMISMSIARVKKSEVNQCFLCHQTTSWNDIRGAGFYKHH